MFLCVASLLSLLDVISGFIHDFFMFFSPNEPSGISIRHMISALYHIRIDWQNWSPIKPVYITAVCYVTVTHRLLFTDHVHRRTNTYTAYYYIPASDISLLHTRQRHSGRGLPTAQQFSTEVFSAAEKKKHQQQMNSSTVSSKQYKSINTITYMQLKYQ